jgi:tRNA dimethylallyltransferase
MLADSFLDEVRRLQARGDLHPELPAIRAVGYRQAWEHLEGLTTASEFRDRGIFATRQLAKRQITWLRSDLGARLFDPAQSGVVDSVADALALFLVKSGAVNGG